MSLSGVLLYCFKYSKQSFFLNEYMNPPSSLKKTQVSGLDIPGTLALGHIKVRLKYSPLDGRRTLFYDLTFRMLIRIPDWTAIKFSNGALRHD
jgi:hypothetical protein